MIDEQLEIPDCKHAESKLLVILRRGISFGAGTLFAVGRFGLMPTFQRDGFGSFGSEGVCPCGQTERSNDERPSSDISMNRIGKSWRVEAAARLGMSVKPAWVKV